MSYDLQIWSADPVILPPRGGQWVAEGSAWLRQGTHGTITVWTSTPAQAEDAPESLRAQVPDLAWLTELSLHDYRSTTTFNRLAQRLAQAARGTVLDPQRAVLSDGLAVARSREKASQTSGNVLAMSWWFGPDVLGSLKTAEQLLEVFETLLPDALPRRYGTFEPPEFHYEREGRQELARFLASSADEFILWYPTPPVAEVRFSLPGRCGASRLGYRTKSLSIGIDAIVLDQPGQKDKLHQLWRSVSLALEPFYGDVRILGRYSRTGKKLVFDLRTTENHPVESWFWAGIPATAPIAAVLGPPYTELWPNFTDAGFRLGDLTFLDSREFEEDGNLWAKLGGLPPELTDPLPQLTPASPVRPLKRPYPRQWPFGEPYENNNT